MIAITRPRPPYLAALGVFIIVWAGYIATLAPTVTFWDAGEFIAAARILGIPHPPGTPLFVLIAHVWGMALPIGEFAFRTNLLSAFLSAAAATFFFLVAHESLASVASGLEERAARMLRIGGGAAAAIVGAFTFTNWQNSNETEVYSAATFTVAAFCWLCHVWRARRAAGGGQRVLLLVVYLAGISMGNHLLALLVGPAVVMFMWATLRSAPATDPARRREEWAHLAVVAGVWALLIGLGLGSTGLITLGLVCFFAAAVFAATSHALGFAVMTLLLAVVGVTPYLYLYIRSGQSPMLNEAAPATWDALLAVIRRAQYPVRTPLDDPTIAHGPENPGRSLSIIWLQLKNYFLYFDWQWARSLTAEGKLTSPLRTVVTLVFLFLGLEGSRAQREADRPAWWLLATLFAVTGLGLVAYMNFRPGFSQGYDLFPDPNDHEVRERDYFFVVSFIVWGVWAGMGLAAVARRALESHRVPRAVAAALLAGAMVPVALNWATASRKHGPDARLAADFAYDLLNTVPPYGILFTYGDNDTFPVWWAQEVEGIRRDVTVVCLALANTEWYIQQLRDNPLREFDEAAAPAIWKGRNATKPTWPVHTMTDVQIYGSFDPNAIRQLGEQGFTVEYPGFSRAYPAGTYPQPNEIVTMRVLQQNLGRRDIVWAVTAGRSFGGLGDRTLQRGIGYAILPTVPDTTSRDILGQSIGGIPLDIPMTERLAWETYRYSGLLREGEHHLESTSESIARAMSLPFTLLAFAYEARNEPAAMARNLDRAIQLNPDPSLRAAFDDLRRRQLTAPLDSASPPPADTPAR